MQSKIVNIRPLAYQSEVHDIKLQIITEEDHEYETENGENVDPSIKVRDDHTSLGFETRREFFHT